MPTKTAMDELSDNDLDLCKAIEILETGFTIRKRQQNIIEKGMQKGNKIINVVVVDMGNYYKLIHAGKFTLNQKFKELMRRAKNEF
jgi:hypothetical protein